MKTLILTLILAMTGFSAYAQQSESMIAAADRGAQIASIVSKVLASPSSGVADDARAALASVINPQDYDTRVSITSFSCAREGYNGVSCDIEIGIDDLNDDDRGWGTVQRVTVDGTMHGGELKVQAATLFLIAG